MDYSKNDRAEQLLGKRPTGVQPFDQPCELGYHCPVCKYKLLVKGEYDERLHWSEYECFLWCSVCNRDYPTMLCTKDLDLQIKLFLDSIEFVTEKAKG